MPPQPPAFSWVIFLTLLVCFAASLTMFLLLVRRWTSQRQWVSLAEWAKMREFAFRPASVSAMPAALNQLIEQKLLIRMHLSSEGVTVMQIETAPPEGSFKDSRWHVLVRRRALRSSAPAGLRPATAPASLLDLYGLSQFPSLSMGQRFAVLATSASSARALSDSASRTLLPPDVGLLLIDDWIILDFSTRPFDPIELDRMIALAQQLTQML